MSAVHICLVSDNLLANLIPVLMEQPAQVWLIATEDMRRKGLARRFQALLTARGVTSTLRGNAPAAGLAVLIEYAAGIAGELHAAHPGRTITLNATGGTKLMALAFVEVFRRLEGANIIYTDTAHQVIESLSDRSARPMRGVLDVAAYLAAHGLTRRCAASEAPAWRARAAARQKLSRWLAREAARLEPFLGALNRLAQQALDGDLLARPGQRFENAPRGLWWQALERIAAAGLLDWNGSAAIRFRDAGAARYLNGFWLEEYAWGAASELKPDDVQCGVEGEWDSGQIDPSRNEFDLLVVHANRMLVVECKTARFGRPGGRDQDILYKLDSLGRTTGGLFGRRLLLSARRLPEQVKSRAASHRIELIEAEQLADFSAFVRDWMNG